MTEPELESKIGDLRRLAAAQEQSIARRLAREEPVPTADINGMVALTLRIDTLERLLEHRRAAALRLVPRSTSSRRRDERGRFVAAT